MVCGYYYSYLLLRDYGYGEGFWIFSDLVVWWELVFRFGMRRKFY